MGTINHTLLTVEYARNNGLTVLGIIISNLISSPDSSSETNPQIIKELSGLPLLGVVPYLSPPERKDPSLIAKLIGEHVDTERLGMM